MVTATSLKDVVAEKFKSALKAGTRDIVPLDNSQVISPTPLKKTEWAELGLRAIREGKVAVITLAGGQGTRLGSSDPKGCYDIGLPSGRSLFQLQAERLRRLAQIASAPHPIRWYIMTSQATHEATVVFFQRHDYFGLTPESVRFFSQGVLPALSLDGKILMSSPPSTMVLAPNGNGGVYEALIDSGVLDEMERAHIEHVHLYCVDNCLVRPADPEFIGACVQVGTDCSSKVVLKTDPSEPVGVFCRSRGTGKLVVAEYSELSREDAELRHPDGSLVYGHANIANHYFSIDFLRRICNPAYLGDLPCHIARKKIPAYDFSTGQTVTVEGVKLEQFIFDTFGAALKPSVYLVDRQTEFAPLKNAPGSVSDGPEHCRRQLLTLHQSWWKSRGIEKSLDEAEINPLDSYEGEGGLFD